MTAFRSRVAAAFPYGTILDAPRRFRTNAMTKALYLPVLLAACAVCTAPVLGKDVPLTWNAKDSSLMWTPCPPFMPKGCEIAVLHGSPKQSNADIFFKLPAKADVPRHWHTSAERMVLVAGELQITYDGHDPVVLKPGTYAYGPPTLPHSAQCRGGGECILFIAFEAPVDAVPGEKDNKK